MDLELTVDETLEPENTHLMNNPIKSFSIYGYFLGRKKLNFSA